MGKKGEENNASFFWRIDDMYERQAPHVICEQYLFKCMQLYDIGFDVDILCGLWMDCGASVQTDGWQNLIKFRIFDVQTIRTCERMCRRVKDC